MNALLRFPIRWPLTSIALLALIGGGFAELGVLPRFLLPVEGVLFLPYYYLRMYLGWALRLTGADAPFGLVDVLLFLPLSFGLCALLDARLRRLWDRPLAP